MHTSNYSTEQKSTLTASSQESYNLSNNGAQLAYKSTGITTTSNVPDECIISVEEDCSGIVPITLGNCSHQDEMALSDSLSSTHTAQVERSDAVDISNRMVNKAHFMDVEQASETSSASLTDDSNAIMSVFGKRKSNRTAPDNKPPNQTNNTERQATKQPVNEEKGKRKKRKGEEREDKRKEEKREAEQTDSASSESCKLDVKLALLYIAREIDDTGEVTQDIHRRVRMLSKSALPIQLQVFATRAELSLKYYNRELPSEFMEWQPWSFSFQQHWRLDYTDANDLLYMHLKKQRLPEWVGILDVLGDLDFTKRSIAILPESIGELIVRHGHLKLTNNLISSLPLNFHTILVDGDIRLDGNLLETLPALFGQIQVGGDLRLNHNRLSALPVDFGNLSVGRNLQLSHNQLAELPKSFGRLDVPGNVTLNRNLLTELPMQIGNIRIGGDFRIDRNMLTRIPAECQDMYVYGYVWLGGNQLDAPPAKGVFPRLIMDNGPKNLCKRRLRRFMTDFILSANCFGLIIFQLDSNSSFFPPWAGWRFALFESRPNMSQYFCVVIIIVGSCNAFSRWIEKCYAMEPSNWRRHVIFPLLWAHLLVAYDMLLIREFESTGNLIIYYAFTLFSFLAHTVVMATVYNWVMDEPFNHTLRRFN